MAAVAFAARLAYVLHTGGLTQVLAYDDGVYYGAADALLSGRLPYSSFVFLHPPAVTLLLAPFAALGRLTSDATGLALARLVFIAIGAGNAVLVARLATRVKRQAGLIAGLLYALWPPAVYAERTALLEPLVTLSALVTLAMATRRPSSRHHVVLAGAAIGIGTATKLWAVVAGVVVVGWLLRNAGWRRALDYVAAASAGFLVICVPFAVAAPRAFVRMAVVDQLQRVSNAVPNGQRLVLIIGGPDPTSAALRITAVVVTIVILIAGAALAVRHPVTRPWLALLVCDGAVLLLGHVFFPYYSSFTAAPIALVVGSTLALLPLTAIATAAALAACAWSAWQLPSPERTIGRAALHAQVADAHCIAADSAAVLIAEDVLTRDLDRGCPVVIDVTGVAYDSDRGTLSGAAAGVQRLHAPHYQALMRRYFAASDSVIVARPAADGFTPATKNELRQRFPHTVRIGGATVYGSCSAKCS